MLNEIKAVLARRPDIIENLVKDLQASGLNASITMVARELNLNLTNGTRSIDIKTKLTNVPKSLGPEVLWAAIKPYVDKANAKIR